MTAQPSGRELPRWVARISDDDLSDELGAGTFARGEAYARSGAVTTLVAGRGGLTLLANVRGSGGRSYQTLVTVQGVEGQPDEPLSWSGRCSCPMQVDCKHVVALLLTARGRLVDTGRPVVTDWEASLAGLLPERPPAGVFAPLALHVAPVTPQPSRYAGSPTPALTLRLHPVTSGKNGGWIRSGVSWRELEYPYGKVRADPGQREVVLALLSTARARAHGGYFPVQQHLRVEDVGPTLWRLLRETELSGIPLVSGSRGELEVRLADAPATVVLDARQRGPGGDVTLSPRLMIPGSAGLEGDIGFVGDPAHGVFVDGRDALVLARCDPPLDPSIRGLLGAGESLHIPAADVPRFVGLYYPALRQRASVESSDGSVAFPEVQPPRLALFVRFEPGHRALVRWSFLYDVGGDGITVPILDHGDRHPRDRAAESALLGSLEALDVLPGLRVVVGTERRLVPEQRLGGLDTATFVGEVLPVLRQRDDIVVTIEGTPLAYAEVEEAPLISVSASDPGGDAVPGDWFDLGITVSVEGEEVPFAPLFAALARGDEPPDARQRHLVHASTGPSCTRCGG